MTTAVSDPVRVQIRLLSAGRALFARLGFEQASTASIAREASTSESQLVRYFGGKAGLLDAILNEIWGALNGRVRQQVADAASAREALLAVAGELEKLLADDDETAYLLLCESWRIRGEVIQLCEGHREFLDQLRRLLRRGRKDGSLVSPLPEAAVLASLTGAIEGMARELLFARRSGQPAPFTSGEMSRAFVTLLTAAAGAA